MRGLKPTNSDPGFLFLTNLHLGPREFNSTSHLRQGPVGLVPKMIEADGRIYDPPAFLRHDMDHAINQNGTAYTKDGGSFRCTCQLLTAFEAVPDANLQNAAHMLWFYFTHEARPLPFGDKQQLIRMVSQPTDKLLSRPDLIKELNNQITPQLDRSQTATLIEAARSLMLAQTERMDEQCYSSGKEEPEKKTQPSAALAPAPAKASETTCELESPAKQGAELAWQNREMTAMALHKSVYERFKKLPPVKQDEVLASAVQAMQASQHPHVAAAGRQLLDAAKNYGPNGGAQRRWLASIGRASGSSSAGAAITSGVFGAARRAVGAALGVGPAVFFAGTDKALAHPENLAHYATPEGFERLNNPEATRLAAWTVPGFSDYLAAIHEALPSP